MACAGQVIGDKVMRKPTIWEKLTEKLGREPTHREACDDVKRILDEGLVELAEKGKLKHQRKSYR